MKLKAENVNKAKGRRRNRNEIGIESRKNGKMHSHEQ